MANVKRPFELAKAGLGDSMSLVVVGLDGAQFEIKTSGDAADYLAQSWANTLSALGERELVPYSPEVVIRVGEDRATVITDDLREESEVIEEVLADGDRAQLSPSDAPGQLYLHAVISDTDAGRIAMIKKKNPTKRARSGKRMFLASDELHGMDEDPWELDPLFDLVVGLQGGFALNTTYFEQLFADAERLRAKVGPWVAGIAAHLPMSTDGQDLLVASCKERPQLRRRLRAIVHRGHIGRVTILSVREHVEAMGLDPTLFVNGKELVVDDANLGGLLRILNEDLTRGGLTGDKFIIESKEPM